VNKVKIVKVGDIKIGGGNPVVIIAGPCVIEGEDITLRTAYKLKEITQKLGISLIFKSSYDKANRTSISGFRGPGIDEGLKILQKVKDKVGIPVLSDVHTVEEVKKAKNVLDVIQIPAFLCRQTDLIVAAGKSQKPINVKKGQFIAPWDVIHIVEKIRSTGNEQILLTERGTTFGYNQLVNDMRSLPIMRDFGYPVVYDATHSVQMPSAGDACSSGDARFIPYLARAAVAVGIDALFMEVHENPKHALCDGMNSLSLEKFPYILDQIKKIDLLIKEFI